MTPPRNPDSLDSLMNRLAADAKARGPVMRWPYAMFTFFALATSVVAVSMGLVIAKKALDWPHGDGAIAGWWTLGTAGLLFVVATVSAMRLAIPGRSIDATTHYVTALLCGALLLSVGSHSLPQGVTWSDGLLGGWECSFTLVLFAIAPLAMLGIALRTGAPVTPGRAGRWAALGGFALALVALDLCCPSEHPAHLLVFHVGAAIVAGGLAVFVFRRALRW